MYDFSEKKYDIFILRIPAYFSAFMIFIILRKSIVIRPETNEKYTLKGPSLLSPIHIILNCIQITWHYFQSQFSVMLLFKANLILAKLKTSSHLLLLLFFYFGSQLAKV